MSWLDTNLIVLWLLRFECLPIFTVIAVKSGAHTICLSLVILASLMEDLRLVWTRWPVEGWSPKLCCHVSLPFCLSLSYFLSLRTVHFLTSWRHLSNPPGEWHFADGWTRGTRGNDLTGTRKQRVRVVPGCAGCAQLWGAAAVWPCPCVMISFWMGGS